MSYETLGRTGLRVSRLSLGASALGSVFRPVDESEDVPSQIPLAPRVLPTGPPGPGPFGAFYTRLKFSPQWDAT